MEKQLNYMKNKNLLLLLTMVFGMLVSNAQQKQINLEEIWAGSFRTKGMDVLHSLKSGKQYTVQNYDRTTETSTIDRYSYKTLTKEETIVSSGDIDAISNFSSYQFSDDEKQIILATNEEPIFRHSRLGNYYVYDVVTKKAKLIYEQKIQEPTFSPDGKKVGFVFDNNIYIKELATDKITQVTTDGIKNKIINGITDWVYEEEFAFVRAFEWSTDGYSLAYLRFDETNVPEFSMDVYGTALYQKQHVFKYPKAGENNSKVSLHMYNLTSQSSNKVDLGNPYYIARLKWTNDASVLSIQVLNRHQNKLKLQFVNAITTAVTTILEETDAAYVDVKDDLTFLNNNSFIWSSEKDGYNHLYHYSREGKLFKQLTSGNWEVTSFYGFSPKTARVYYQSTEKGSINRAIYSVGINAKGKKLLTTTEGTNRANFSADYTYFINSYSSAATPPRYTLNKAKDGKELKEIVNNNTLAGKLAGYQISKKEFNTININGNDLNMWTLKPADFDANKTYPLFMTQYSGPGSQSVSNSWGGSNDYWYQMLANQGYIVVCVDGRGTGFKGRDFKKVTYLNLVKYETEDQIAAAKKLSERAYIDADRTGIWGWSYGGHMSTNCLLKGNDTFEMAVAVAPVTSWRFYDTVYTERFMRTPQENPEGYDNNSPFNYPELLKGKYLLIHGSGDDNVHVQHTMRMVEALIQANKQFDWAIYPDKNHGIYGGNTRLQLFTKMTNFIHANLGDKRGKEEEVKIKAIKG